MLSQKHLSTHFSGAIAKTIVVKQYQDKTVITTYPNMSRITATTRQQQARTAFAEAVAYASAVNKDPLLKSAFAAGLPAGNSVFHAALKRYLLQIKNRD